MKLLIIEDDEQVVKILVKCLESCAEDPIVVRSKAAALEILRMPFAKDGILLDLRLQKVDDPNPESGIAVFSAIRNASPSVPIIVLSGAYDAEVHELLAKEGGTFLIKQEAARTPGKLCLEVENAIKKYNNFQALKALSLRRGMSSNATK